MSDVRIGVFICHCGINIGGVVNVPEVVEYVKGLPDVVHAERNLFTCSEEGISAIGKAIPEYNLNRVVVASCTPRTHEPLFRSTCEEAGLNKYLFEFVNIRDQCSWVHMREPDEATEKAKDLIRMGVARARLLEPLSEVELPVIPACLVLGGGVMGMSAALNLADQGFEVHLVEKSPKLGGILLSLHKLFPTSEEAEDLVERLSQRVREHPKITTYLSCEAREISGFVGNFTALLDQEGKENKVNIGTIIVATGALELKPHGQYGYGDLPNVVTQLELEEKMKKGEDVGRNVVMINCVGARVPERTYCGRICCMVAIKNAALIRKRDPESKVFILHRDLMAYGVEYEDEYRRSMEGGVRFIRYDVKQPPEIIGNGKAKEVKVWHELLKREIDIPCDTVVLTTPLIPGEDNEVISRMLKVPLSEQGFFLEAHLKLMPVEFATDGIYLCGSARWPTDIPEGISQSLAAAAKAAIPMRRGKVSPEAITSFVDEERCSGCGVCVELCPYQALELLPRDGRRVSHTIEALCKGCGTCGAACPAGAISMHHYRDEQIFAQIEALAGSI
jgi:heterodisulfide reductase subunit A